MPYQKHPTFVPPNDGAIIWRFMTLPKLISLLDKKALYFARTTELEDPYEGQLSRVNITRRAEIFQSFRQLYETEEQFKRTIFESAAGAVMLNAEIRALTLVNCWHLNQDESASMWKLYASNNEGVAVQSTFNMLCNSFSQADDVVYVGKVKYIDYTKDMMAENNGFEPFVTKRRSFEAEHELRAVTSLPHSLLWEKLQQFKGTNSNRMDLSAADILAVQVQLEKGKYVATDLNTLVNKIYIAPMAPSWYVGAVWSVISKYLDSKEIIKSDLYSLK